MKHGGKLYADKDAVFAAYNMKFVPATTFLWLNFTMLSSANTLVL